MSTFNSLVCFARFAAFFASFAVKSCPCLNRSRILNRKGRQGIAKAAKRAVCDTEIMAPPPDPKSVKVNLTTGTGVDIEWKDGHRSHYPFPFLRDACPCALCDDERGRVRPQAWRGTQARARRAAHVQGGGQALVGRRRWANTPSSFTGMMATSWASIRGSFCSDVCPCEECKGNRAAAKTE